MPRVLVSVKLLSKELVLFANLIYENLKLEIDICVPWDATLKIDLPIFIIFLNKEKKNVSGHCDHPKCTYIGDFKVIFLKVIN